MKTSMPHPSSLPIDQLLGECDITRVKRSGPGGQRRNKVETGVVLLHRPTGISAEASERRSQIENQKIAVDRLRLKLAIHVRSDRGIEQLPSSLWRSRCPQGRIKVNVAHRDFAELLAEVFDCLTLEQWNVKSAADRLGCSSSQVVKFLATHPAALTQLNKERENLGLSRLKA